MNARKVIQTLLITSLPAVGLALAANEEAVSAEKSMSATYRISIDQAMWSKWGFQYPVTYIFEASGPWADARIHRRDSQEAAWKKLQQEPAGKLFNGIECVRLDSDRGRILVSVGFATSNVIELRFDGVASVKYTGVARYYDDRKAAYTLSLDNWGCNRLKHNPWNTSGAPWKGTTNDASDCYQAALHVCRDFHLPVSIAINSRLAGGEAMWNTMHEELNKGDSSWEPAVHASSHPMNAAGYKRLGYEEEILGCRRDILSRLRNIPYGQYIFEHILTSGYQDEKILSTSAGEFLFIRGFNWQDNPTSTGYAQWDKARRYYGVGGYHTKCYDLILMKRKPEGRYFAGDVAELNEAFDEVLTAGGIFYALWHPDRYRNSVLYDPSPGQDGVRGSTLMQHLAHVANRNDVWYVANGWLYCYRYVSENAAVRNVSIPDRENRQ